jgi:hypothetical protein
MPYGIPDRIWDTLSDSAKKDAMNYYNKNTGATTQTGGTPTRTLVGTYNEPGFQSGHSQPPKPITETFKSDPITNQLVPTGQATQPTFDPYRYIKELQDAARSKPTKELRAAMAKELSRID